jgi:hypothetical protein
LFRIDLKRKWGGNEEQKRNSEVCRFFEYDVRLERKKALVYLPTYFWLRVWFFVFVFVPVFRLSLSQRKFLLDHGRKKDRLMKEAGTTHVMSFMLLPLWFLATVTHIWYAFLHAKWKVSFSLSAGNRPE